MTSLNGKLILKIVGMILIILGVSMVPPLFASLFYGEMATVRGFAICLIPMIAGGIILMLKIHPRATALRMREGYLIVFLCWMIASATGALPYIFSGAVPSFIDAFFESTSGFTTTGAVTIDLSVLPSGLILWKAMSNLLGGMGILVFAISILPMLGIGGQQIVKAEAPGPALDKVTTRISDSAKILYVTYAVFAAAEFVLLLFSPMTPFDALVHTFGSISTTGLGYHPEGILYYDSFYIEGIISLFTILASINFVLYAQAIRGNWRELASNVELRVFFAIILIATVLVSLTLYSRGVCPSLTSAFRQGGFQVIAFATTSGYAIGDLSAWPGFCIVVLFTLLFIGGCASSTCGSIKVIRILVLLKLIARGVTKRIHPRSVMAIKIGGKPVSSEEVSTITSFILTYLAVFVASSLILSLQNLDLTTTLSAAASILSNTGCAFGLLGAHGDYSIFAPPLRLFLSFLMIVGRLEIFTVILLLSPKFWNPDR